ncbi:hypothetical protein HZB03_01440 [Candidatus Woesearchaeota archaeon]|nr:hypothetical protein [Candidatus Woesearchaeota archaeon]
MLTWHGIIVDKSLQDPGMIDDFKILGQKVADDDPNDVWTLYRVEVKAHQIDRAIKRVQQNLQKGWYAHFYKDKDLIVVFADRIFRVTTDPETWKAIILYGKNLHIPADQLDFFPCNEEDETF